ncbi:hypothetical protein ABXJ76_02860 [Methylobacter sp. G7]
MEVKDMFQELKSDLPASIVVFFCGRSFMPWHPVRPCSPVL